MQQNEQYVSNSAAQQHSNWQWNSKSAAWQRSIAAMQQYSGSTK
jgi:hypothetical protein